jgi:hypothetical protein
MAPHCVHESTPGTPRSICATCPCAASLPRAACPPAFGAPLESAETAFGPLRSFVASLRRRSCNGWSGAPVQQRGLRAGCGAPPGAPRSAGLAARARSALRELTRRRCLSGVSAANAASSAMRAARPSITGESERSADRSSEAPQTARKPLCRSTGRQNHESTRTTATGRKPTNTIAVPAEALGLQPRGEGERRTARRTGRDVQRLTGGRSVQAPS